MDSTVQRDLVSRKHGPNIVQFLWSVIVGLAAVPAFGIDDFSQVNSAKVPFLNHMDPYGSVELRHHYNVWVGEDDGAFRRVPAVHGKLLLGTQLYGGHLDVFFRTGVVKYANSQQYSKSLSQFEIDFRPWFSQNGAILFYGIHSEPMADENIEENDDPDTWETGAHATLGVKGLGRIPLDRERSLLVLVSSENYTKFFQQQQFRANGDEVTESRFWSLVNLGLFWQVTRGADLSFRLQATSRSRFTESSQAYEVRRDSWYSARVKYDLNSRIYLTNDFYQFFAGTFEERNRGFAKRYRNILRLTFNL